MGCCRGVAGLGGAVVDWHVRVRVWGVGLLPEWLVVDFRQGRGHDEPSAMVPHYCRGLDHQGHDLRLPAVIQKLRGKDVHVQNHTGSHEKFLDQAGQDFRGMVSGW